MSGAIPQLTQLLSINMSYEQKEREREFVCVCAYYGQHYKGIEESVSLNLHQIRFNSTNNYDDDNNNDNNN